MSMDVIIANNKKFQSPFKRGNDCGYRNPATGTVEMDLFQSPFKRGNDCGPTETLASLRREILLFQSPFKRGNDCGLQKLHQERTLILPSFNPLSSGAMTAGAMCTDYRFS